MVARAAPTVSLTPAATATPMWLLSSSTVP